ncbi:conserved protein of unknown function [Burkholderia multivorans]
MYIVMIVALALALHARHLHRQLTGATLVRRDVSGGMLRHEVWRRVRMELPPKHVSAYAEPREVRMRVLRFAGVACWCEELSVALPVEACSRLGDIAAQEFDERFPARLQLAPQ